MFIDGFGIAGFRSFGPELVKIPDLDKVNVFIGKNNSGKSNILAFVEKFFASNRRNEIKGQNNIFSELDHHKSGNTIAADIDIAIQWKQRNSGQHYFWSHFPEIFAPDNVAWFTYKGAGSGNIEDDADLCRRILEKCTTREIERMILSRHLGAVSNPKSMAMLLANHIRPELPFGGYRIYTVPTFREITTNVSEAKDPRLSGSGLIKVLAELQHPNLGKDHDVKRNKFQQITDLLRDLLGEPEAEIDIPHTHDDINVTIRGKKLPIEALGTGIHQVIMLAAAVTAYDNSIVCLEEPETNLHPALQKELINYLLSTNNQYFISTHSNAFIDNPKVRVYRCWLENSATKCAPAEFDSHKHAILDDLGCKASDILQANCVIWVEGPSDRIYLNHWIKSYLTAEKAEKDWVEGIHYSIMFYGGRLLCHLTHGADSAHLEDIAKIQLSKLNRNSAILIDSDRSKSTDEINASKRKIKAEFEANNAFVWVTAGREIENYIDASVVQEYCKSKVKWAKFSKIGKVYKGVDKIDFAKHVATRPIEYPLDLKERIEGLVNFIETTNSLK